MRYIYQQVNPTGLFSCFILCLLFIRCTGDGAKQKPVAPPATKASPAAAEAVAEGHPYNKAADTLYPVYQLTGKSLGVVLAINDDGNTGTSVFFDSILQASWNLPGRAIDSGSSYDLLENGRITQLVAPRLQGPLYIYGTRGYTLCRPGTVVYSQNECRTNVLARLLPGLDTSACGRPLFCSKALIRFRYGRQPDAERRLNEHERNMDGDYKLSRQHKGAGFRYQ